MKKIAILVALLGTFLVLGGCSSYGIRGAGGYYVRTVISSGMYARSQRAHLNQQYSEVQQHTFNHCVISEEQKILRGKGTLTNADIAWAKDHCKYSNETVIAQQKAEIQYHDRLNRTNQQKESRVNQAKRYAVSQAIDAVIYRTVYNQH